MEVYDKLEHICLLLWIQNALLILIFVVVALFGLAVAHRVDRAMSYSHGYVGFNIDRQREDMIRYERELTLLRDLVTSRSGISGQISVDE